MKKKRILAILGSTKKESSNRVILELVAQIFSEVAEVTVYDRLASLPHFNPDSEAELPKSVQELREAIEMADGILISTPEYVFSIPGSLKNAIEWQVSTVLFSEKPVALIVAAASGEKALESLELIMVTLGAIIAPNSKLLLKGIKGKISSEGEISDSKVIDEIRVVVGSLLESIDDSTASAEGEGSKCLGGTSAGREA